MAAPTRFSPACRKALRYLEKHVRIARRDGRRRLPPIAELAKGAGVSTASMHKASSYLCTKGVLRSSPRRGTMVAEGARLTHAPPEQVTSSPLDTPARWEVVRRHIHERILRGDYIAGAMLPPYKELYQTYGTGFATLKKALNALAEQGMLIPCRRGYRVFSSAAPHPSTTVLFVSKLPVASSPDIRSEGALPFSLAVQREVHRANCSMAVIDNMYGTGESHWMHEIHAAVRARSVLGIAFSAPHFISEESRRIIRSLSRLRIPIALLDTKRTVYPNTEFITAPNVRLFAISSQYQAGQKVANHLLAHGHHRICYVSPFGSALWDQQRLLGARTIYGGTEAASVTACVSDSWANKGTAREKIVGDPAFESVRTAAETVEHYLGDPPSRTGAFIEQHALPYLLNESIRRLAQPLFTAALEHTDATAWMLPNDTVMNMAHGFLTERGIAVPGDISLVGFDDTAESAMKGLDSYNFNVTRVIQNALGYILTGIRSGGTRFPDTLIEIPGFIVSRGSVRTITSP